MSDRPRCKEVVEKVVIGVPTQYVYDETAPGLCRLPDPTPDATVASRRGRRRLVAGPAAAAVGRFTPHYPANRP
jgi:hypothetical protein